jgi:chorismate mutase
MKSPSFQSPKKDLAGTRLRIAHLDRAFLEVFRAYLAERSALARHVGRIKRDLGISVRDAAIEEKVHSRFMQKLRTKLPESAIRALSNAILRESRQQQKP